MMKLVKIIVLVLILLLGGYYLFKPKTMPTTPKNPIVTLHTSAGDITLALDSQNTPITTNNFLTLAQKGFYDKTIFHHFRTSNLRPGHRRQNRHRASYPLSLRRKLPTG